MPQLKQSGTCAANASVTYGDGSWRSSRWSIVNLTAAETVVTLSDKQATQTYTITIPAANSFWLDIWGDFQKMTVTSGATVSYLIYDGD